MVKARGEFTVAPLSDGSDGRGVVSVTTYFLATNLSTGVTTKTSGWGTALQPLTPTKKYLWEYSVTAYDNGTPTTTAPVIKGVYGDKGDDGVSVTSMVEEYYYSTSPTTQSDGSWTTTYPAWVGGKYLWLRIKTVYSNSTITYTKPMNVTGQKGETGSQGVDKFLWIKYADDDKGAGMSDSGVDKKYIGVSPNQLTAKESDNPSDYKWSPMYDLGALDDITLADKTEILSGTEIFTDKADDAIVHVDIDGKSYQNAGSGKNLIEFNLLQQTTPGRVRYPLNKLETEKSHYISFKNKKFYFWNGSMWANEGLLNPDIKNIGFIIISKGNTGGGIDYALSELINEGMFQIEEGSIATTYEPPAPTPEYPVEIESLNNFDIVSSVGRENLLPNSKSAQLNHNNDGGIDKTEFKNGIGKLTLGANRGLSTYNNFSFFDISNLSIGKEYTASIDVMSEKDRDIYLGWNMRHTAQFIEANKWYRVSKTVVFSEEAIIKHYLWGLSSSSVFPSETSVYYKNPKIETGNSDSQYATSPEDILYDTKSPTLYKTNISLSEPLRSVGDVKDRLFRDTDGLWKVERKIGSYTMTGEEGLNKGAPSYDGEISTNRFIYPHVSHGKELAGATSEIRVVSSHLKHQTQGWSLDIPNTCTTNVNQLHMRFDNKLIGVGVDDSEYQRNFKFKQYVKELYESAEPLTFIYILKKFDIETLSQELQDKLNNIASYKNSNYLYTIVDKTNILPEYVRENLKPNLHATFKSKAWYRNFKTDTNVVDSQANKFKMAQQEKRVLDERYKELYAHSKLSGSVKTALYNAKIAFNTVFMALEISLHHYILEKTESRLSELEAVYSGGNGYVSAKAILEVALDNAQSNITEGVTDDKTGRNRWIGKKYTWTDTVKIAPKLSHIRGLEPVETVAIDDTKVFTFNDDRYLAHFFTYLYSDKAKTITTTVAHDDSFTLAVNGQEVISTNATIPAPYAVSIPLSKGWNQIDMLLQEGTGGDHITLGHELSTLVDDMSCYLGGGFSASQIRQLSDEIDIRVQKGDVINAINVSTEGIRLEGKKVSIDGKTEFKEDLVMKSGVIQSADGGTRLDLNKNTFTFDKPFTIGKSQVATDKDVKDSIDGIEIGGENLVNDGNFATESVEPIWYNNGGVVYELVENKRTAKVGLSSGIYQYLNNRGSNTSNIYTYSFLAKSEAENTQANVGFLNSGSGASNRFKLTDKWKRYSFTTEVPVLDNSLFHIYSAGKSFNITDIKVERGNVATEWSPSQEDIYRTISSAQKSAEAVAVAKANLAEINAKAHADGKVTAEEKARIAQAQTNLNTAMAEAKKKADEAKQYADEGILADKKIKDTRNDNENPSWYFKNYPRQTVRELKYSTVMGVSEAGHSYGVLTTEVPWTDRSGGVVKQEFAISNKAYKRFGDALTWSEWVSYDNIAEDAKASADTAIQNASNAQSSANTANGLLTDLASDSKLTPTEKKTVKKEWDIIVDERPKLLATATSSGVSSTAYTDKYNTLNTYITPLLASLGATSNIVGVTFRAHFRNYYNARQDLLNAITDKAKEYAEAQANKALADAKVDATDKADEAKRSAEAVAVAKANLAEINAKAHADGKVTAEEKARIAQAQTNLNTAMAEAKKKADEAERLAKLHADKQVGDIEVGGRNLFTKSILLLGEVSGVSGLGYAEDDYQDGFKVTGGNNGLAGYVQFNNVFDSDGNYTVSFKMRGTQNINQRVIVEIAGVSSEYLSVGNTSNDYTRLSFTAKIENLTSAKNYIRFKSLGYSYYRFDKIQVERGTKATDWTMAPEDVDIKIDDKADKETTEDLQQSLDSLNQVVGEIGIEGIREQLIDYQKLLANVNKDAKIANSRLEQILSDNETGEITRINNILGKLTDKWVTQEGFININGDETELSIHKGDVSMVLGSAGLVFYSGGEAVATITNQYMRIDRGIFAESIHVGRHQWSPLKRNKDHLLLNFVGDPLI